MSITKDLILDLISKGESEHVEFKTRLANENDISRILTAFANTDGGYLIVGIGDKGKIHGLTYEEAVVTHQRITQICSSLFSFHFEVDFVSINNDYVVCAKITKAPKHLSPITTSTGEIYFRNFDQTVKIRRETKMFSRDDEVCDEKLAMGFIAMSFRTEEEPALVDYYEAMCRAVIKTKLPIKLKRIDLQEGDYEISSQIMKEIDSANFVIADFTLNPHNVYFEIGYARGCNKPIIQCATKTTVLQFDVRNWKTVFYRNATELEEKLIPALKECYNSLNLNRI